MARHLSALSGFCSLRSSCRVTSYVDMHFPISARNYKIPLVKTVIAFVVVIFKVCLCSCLCAF